MGTKLADWPRAMSALGTTKYTRINSRITDKIKNINIKYDKKVKTGRPSDALSDGRPVFTFPFYFIKIMYYPINILVMDCILL